MGDFAQSPREKRAWEKQLAEVQPDITEALRELTGLPFEKPETWITWDGISAIPTRT